MCPDLDAFSSSAGNSMSAVVEDNPLAVLGIPRYIADTIWQRTSTLLQHESNFALAPGNSS